MKFIKHSAFTLSLVLLTLIITIFLFLYLSSQDNRSSSFTFTLIYVCILEILFYGFLFGISATKENKKLLGASYSVIGTLLLFYLIYGLACVLFYNLLLSDFVSTRIYYSSIIIGSTLFIIILGFVLKLDTNQSESQKQDNFNKKNIRSITEGFELLERKYNRLLKNKSLPDISESTFTSNLQKLTTKIKFLPPNAITDSELTQSLGNIKERLEKLINDFEKSDGNSSISIKNQIDSLINNSIDKIISQIILLKK